MTGVQTCALPILRALRETKIKGVKTNIGFLMNVLQHPDFIDGECNTGFIASNPELLDISPSRNREKKLLQFLGTKVVNETGGHRPLFNVPKYPDVSMREVNTLKGTKQLLDREGIKVWRKEVTF